MSGAYSLQYAPDAAQARDAMAPAARVRLDTGMRRLAADPYGHGSSAIGEEKDRRQAAVGPAVVLYYVSSTVLTVTVVRLVYI